MSELGVRESTIQGVFEIDLVVLGDNRGWFKENYQKAKMESLGLPSFEIVQNNVSFNAEVGVTRGIHAEPWEKFISVTNGRVFSAIVDLRAGEDFGRVECFELSADKAIYVPRGCGNSFQTLDPNVVYTYLVNDHWSPEAEYTFVNLYDEELAVQWPIDRSKSIVSEKDLNHPTLAQLRHDTSASPPKE